MKAIFLGTFNPPHKGHKDVIDSVISYFSKFQRKEQLESIHIIPCWQNPNKSKSTEYWDRYKMCQLELVPLFDSMDILCYIDDIEAKLKPEYTYELIRYFHSNSDEYIKDDFWWIITTETLLEIVNGQWKNGEYLLKNNKFIWVYTENPNGDLNELKILEYFNKIGKDSKDYIYVPLVSTCDIHSTQLREMIKNKENVDKYINLGVRTYIQLKQLYL